MSRILLEEPSRKGRQIITVNVLRHNPSTSTNPKLQQYEVPCDGPMSILTLLRQIHEHIDPSLAFRTQQCNQGICNVCRVRLESNSKVVKSCKTLIQPGEQITILPHDQEKVIRDLATEG